MRCEVRPRVCRRSVGQLLEIGDQFAALAAASDGGRLTPSTAADLIRGGHANALVGQPEGAWLDAKGGPYHVDSDERRLEFAKDVAAFANARTGGLLALGLVAHRTPRGDIIQKVTPFPDSMMGLRNDPNARDDVYSAGMIALGTVVDRALRRRPASGRRVHRRLDHGAARS